MLVVSLSLSRKRRYTASITPQTIASKSFTIRYYLQPAVLKASWSFARTLIRDVQLLPFVTELSSRARGVSTVLLQRIPPCCTSCIQTVLAIRKQIHSSQVPSEQKQTKEMSPYQPYALLWCASYVKTLYSFFTNFVIYTLLIVADKGKFLLKKLLVCFVAYKGFRCLKNNLIYFRCSHVLFQANKLKFLYFWLFSSHSGMSPQNYNIVLNGELPFALWNFALPTLSKDVDIRGLPAQSYLWRNT
jgi:hypothetical protein